MGKLEIHVKTADKKRAGSKSGKIYVRLHDDQGTESDAIHLKHFLHRRFRRGQTDIFTIPRKYKLGQVMVIELWKEGEKAAADWFCEVLYILDKKSGVKRSFPIQCWIQPYHRYVIFENNTSLPQNDGYSAERREVLERKRKLYDMAPRVQGMPTEVIQLPEDERFSDEYQWDLDKRRKNLLLKAMWAKITHGRWHSLDDLMEFYKEPLFPKPKSIHRNSLTDDHAFGAQRIVGCNPTQIRLCTVIPHKLAVTDDMVQEHLEGMTLSEAVNAKRLFIIDYEILKDFPMKEGRTLCAPIALFFLTERQILLPVAIQLFQDPAFDNPVFTPSDPVHTWQCAKLWFNNSDASVHQSLTHLGLTHLLMEGVVCAAHRQLAPQHPIFRLLAPHFLYLIGINWSAHNKLLNEKGWVDKTMAIARDGFFELVSRGAQTWRLDVEGTLPNALKERGVLSEDVLPNYGYRDDALLYYYAIRKYVENIVSIYYPVPGAITEDYELQAWAEELAKPTDKGGVGLKGIPHGGRFETIDDIVLVSTSVIFTCSVQHAAVNFGQYDEYGFPQNYPGFLHGTPPKDKSPLTQQDLLHMHAGVDETLNMIVVTRILSEKATKSLGDWEMRFQYDSRALEAEDVFRSDLKEIGKKIKRSNKERPMIYQYDYLLPEGVPNSISI